MEHQSRSKLIINKKNMFVTKKYFKNVVREIAKELGMGRVYFYDAIKGVSFGFSTDQKFVTAKEYNILAKYTNELNKEFEMLLSYLNLEIKDLSREGKVIVKKIKNN